MSQIILDDQIYGYEVLKPLENGITVQRLGRLRPGEIIKDERVPTILQQLKQPTFVTIDDAFWKKSLRDARYCILYFPLQNKEQQLIPDLLRQLFKLTEFRTRVARMGKVARVSTAQINYWQVADEQLYELGWAESSNK